MNESMDMQGRLTLRLIDRDGRVAREQRQHNRIVRSGRQMVAQLFAGTIATPTWITHIGIGTGGDAPSDSQTALVSERVPRKPIAAPTLADFAEISAPTPLPGPRLTTARIKVSVSAEFDFGEGNGADPLLEAAIFTAETGGTMYNRVVFDPVVKSGAFKLSLLWEILF